MPLRGGESVGSAYVSIYADGRGVPDDIRRMLDEAEPSVREAGRRHGEQYTEGFDDQASKSFKTHFGKGKNEMFENLNESLTASIRRIDLADSLFSSPAWRKFTSRMTDEFGDAGALAAKKLEAQFRDSGNLEGLADQMRNSGQMIRAAQKDILLAAERDEADSLRRRNKEWADYLDLAYAENKDFDRKWRNLIDDQEMEYRLHIDKLSRSNMDVSNAIDKFTGSVERNRFSLRRVRPDLDHYDKQMHRIGDGVGRMFGRGSRNDFINFIGSMARGLTMLIGGVGRVGTDIFKSFGSAFTGAGGGIKGMVAGLGQSALATGAGFITLTAAVSGFVAILGVLLLVAGPVVAILSGLLGIIVALAGTISYALVAAVAVIGPLLLPLAAIIGGIVAAVFELKDAGGQVKKTMNEMKDAAKDWLDTFEDAAFKNLPKYLSDIADQFSKMDSFATAMGKGFDRFMGEFIKTVTGPEMNHFFNRFERFLPGAMDRLGTIIGNITEGLAGIFTASIPHANRFLRWLEDITDEFSKWANSPEGRKEIKQFLEDAGDSAEALGGFLDSAWGWLKKLLSEGRDTGDTIFTNMADDFERWTKWMEDHPDALNDWFTHAEEIAKDIGDIVDAISELIDDLDTAENRETGSDWLNGLADVLRLVADLAWAAQFAFHALTNPGKAGDDLATKLFGDDWQDSFDRFISGIGTRVKELWNKYMPDLDMPNPAEKLGSGLMQTKIIQMANAASKLPGLIRSHWNGIPGLATGIFNRLPPRAQDAVIKIGRLFQNAPGLIVNAFSGLGDLMRAKFDAAVGRLKAIPGQIVDLFRGLGAAIIAAIGNIIISPKINWPNLNPGGNSRTPTVPGPAQRLSATDPAVRALSLVPALPSIQEVDGNSGTPTVDASGWVIMSNSEDPWVVAKEVLNDLVAKIA